MILEERDSIIFCNLEKKWDSQNSILSYLFIENIGEEWMSCSTSMYSMWSCFLLFFLEVSLIGQNGKINTSNSSVYVDIEDISAWGWGLF